VIGKHSSGKTFPLELSVSEVRLGGNRRIFTGIVRDVSERRRLEQEILRIGDQERRRIGQDLHDGLGQMLTGIGLISQSLARRMDNQGQAEGKDVGEITALIKEADQFARSLSRSLVPVDLEARGLVAALRRLAGNAERLFRIRCTFEERGDALIHDETTASHLYRIAQEAVSNAVKHGHATEVNIGLASEETLLRLWIRDDGSGFAEDWREHQGLGVRTMAYRARIIGATLDISAPSEDQSGTEITCTLRNANILAAQP
jgi:signal transduction histidine kinase